jgi:membrane-associated phospholipid phosphatase
MRPTLPSSAVSVDRCRAAHAGSRYAVALAAFGVVVALAFVMGTGLRNHLEWYDAYAELFVNSLQGSPALDSPARTVSSIGPYIGIALVLLAFVVAWRRGARLAELMRPLATLGFALLCVELLKLTISRDRPFHLVGLQHDSFPSGDTAQVALCAAAALHLGALRKVTRDPYRLGMAVVGSTAALIVGLSRVYLGRHWASDVVASLLIGVVFWAFAPGWRVSMRGVAIVAAAIVAVMTSGPLMAFPSPMTFDDGHQLELPVTAVLVAPSGPYEGVPATWTFRATSSAHSMLQLQLVPQEDVEADCLWLDLDLDRGRVMSRPLAPYRRIYAFPLPQLVPGLHELHLQTHQDCRRPLLRLPSFGLSHLSIEGLDGDARARL